MALGSPEAHTCIGDYVFRAPENEISIGVRLRANPDFVEVLFSDFGNVQSPVIEWLDDSVRITDQHDGSDIVLICKVDGASLILPKDDYQPSRVFKMKRVEGSLWEVGQREGWLTAE